MIRCGRETETMPIDNPHPVVVGVLANILFSISQASLHSKPRTVSRGGLKFYHVSSIVNTHWCNVRLKPSSEKPPLIQNKLKHRQRPQLRCSVSIASATRGCGCNLILETCHKILYKIVPLSLQNLSRQQNQSKFNAI